MSGVIVSWGPGSYTGLRVGIMSAKTLAFATGCRLVAIETFRVIAEQTPRDVRAVDVLADAQQGQVYWQSFVRGEADRLTGSRPLSIVPIPSWLAERDPSAWITGPAVDVYGDQIPGNIRRANAHARQASVDKLLELGWEAFQRAEFADPLALEPLYLRPSSAEEKWQTRAGRNPSDRT